MLTLLGGAFLLRGLDAADALQRGLLFCERRPVFVRCMRRGLCGAVGGCSRVHPLRRRVHIIGELHNMRHLRALALQPEQVQVLH